jgi:intein/homing endonuclease
MTRPVDVRSTCGRYKMGEYRDGKLHIKDTRHGREVWLTVDHALLDRLESQVTTK